MEPLKPLNAWGDLFHRPEAWVLMRHVQFTIGVTALFQGVAKSARDFEVGA